MTRESAARFLRSELNKHNLQDWGIRISPVEVNNRVSYLGMCLYNDKCIVLNAHHIDLHSEPDIINTIRHEIAHALTPGHNHDMIWEDKARALGCDNIAPCSHLELSSDIIDAIRSGATVNV